MRTVLIAAVSLVGLAALSGCQDPDPPRQTRPKTTQTVEITSTVPRPVPLIPR